MSHLHTAPHASEDKNADAAPVAMNSEAKAMGAEPEAAAESAAELDGMNWSADGLAELKKIPFFVRGKVKRNTEKFAGDRGISSITVDTLYEAKAAIGK